MDERRGELKPGTVLAGEYRVENQIGAGGFAITYKGTQISNAVTVAIKEFFPADSSVETEREKQRFLREAHILREFDYLESIVTVRNVFEEDGRAYLVMDYIEGITLEEYVEQYGPVSWEEIVAMVTPVMKSLTKIHRRNVMHCDISPDNLIIGMDNRLWLIDFGANQRADASRNRTVIIKKGYAPVEQYYSDSSTPDGRIGAWTDVYALAATMYLALTGEKPRAAVERMKEHLRKASSDQEREALGGILEEWQTAAMMKAMMPGKAERYATMDEFLEAITFPPNETKNRTRIVSGRFGKHSIGMGVFFGLTWVVLLAIVVYLVFLGRQGRLWTAVSEPREEMTALSQQGDSADETWQEPIAGGENGAAADGQAGTDVIQEQAAGQTGTGPVKEQAAGQDGTGPIKEQSAGQTGTNSDQGSGQPDEATGEKQKAAAGNPKRQASDAGGNGASDQDADSDDDDLY